MDPVGIIAIIVGVILIVRWMIGLRAGSRKPRDWRRMLTEKPLTPRRLTEVYAEAMRAEPSVRSVSVRGELEVQVDLKDGTDTTNYLENMWREIAMEPGAAEAVLERHLRAVEQSKVAVNLDVAAEMDAIVPTVRDEQYLEQPPFVDTYREVLTADLYIIYVMDLPDVIRVLNKPEIEKLGIDHAALRRRSLQNLHRIIRTPEIMGDGPVKMVICGGNYESSLLLVADFWEQRSKEVSGKLVACVPCRDILYFTGSDDQDSIQFMAELAEKMMNEGDHTISPTLIVWDGNSWSEFVRSS